MTHDNVLGYINFVANKHQEGLVLKPEQYSMLCNTYNHVLFKREYEQAELVSLQQSIPIYNQLINSSLLRGLKKTQELTGSSGVYTLPSDYVFPYVLRAKYSAKSYDIDFVPESEYTSSFGRVATFGGDKVKISPTPDGSVHMEYLSKPLDVYYDWCVNEDTDQVIYLPPGYTISFEGTGSGVGDSLVMRDSDGNVIWEDVYHVSGDYPYTSKSVEFAWEERGVMKIIGLILASMGVNLKDQSLIEFGIMNQQQ